MKLSLRIEQVTKARSPRHKLEQQAQTALVQLEHGDVLESTGK